MNFFLLVLQAQSDEPLDDAVVVARAQLQHASDALLTARKCESRSQ